MMLGLRKGTVLACLLLLAILAAPVFAQVNWTPTGLMSGNVLNVTQCGSPTFYMATTGTNVYRSTDGITWTDQTAQFLGAQVYCFVTWVETPFNYRVGAGTSAGFFKSIDNGTTWTQGTVMPTNISVWALASPGGGRLIAGTSDGIYYSLSYDGYWSKRTTLTTVTDCYSFTTYMISGRTDVYAGTNDGVYRSIDPGGGNYGNTWVEFNTAATDTLPVRSVATAGSNILAAVWSGGVGQGVFKSGYSAAAWAASNTGLGNLNVNCLGISTNLYAATDNGVYESTTGGTSWADYSSGLPNRAVRFLGSGLGSALCTPLGGGVYKKGAPILMPVLVSPANNATTVPVPTTLTWTYPTAVTNFEVQYSTSATFASGNVTISNVLTNTVDVPGLNPSSNYYWRVRAFVGGYWTNWAAGYKFTTADFPWPPTTPTAVALAPASPLTNDNLTATASGSIDYNPADTVSYLYQWRVSNNGGATYGAWGYDGATLNASNTRRGQKWQCQARATDGALNSAWVASATTLTVGDTAPTVATGITFAPAAPQDQDNVVATPTGATDADGDSLVYEVEWAVSFDSGATYSSWIPFGATLPADATSPSDKWKCHARANDGTLAGLWFECPNILTIGSTNTPPTPPTAIAFNPPAPTTVDNIVATASGSTDAQNSPITYNYEWAVSTDNGATWSPWGYAGDTLLAINRSHGQQWKCHAQASDGVFVSGWYESPTILTIPNSPPSTPTTANINPPTPDTTVDLTATGGGSIDPDNDPITYNFEWRSSADGGTTWTPWGNPGVTLSAALTTKGQIWEMWVQASDGVSTSGWFICPTQVTILNAAPTSPAVPVISPPNPGDASDLVVVPSGSTDPDGDPITYAGEWSVSTDGGTTWSPFSAANTTNNGLTLLAAATTTNNHWKVHVQASDGTAASAWVESAPVIVGNLPPTSPSVPVISPATPGTANDLVVVPSGSTDPNGDVITYNTEWCSSTDGGTTWTPWSAANTTNAGATLLAAATTKGEQWKAQTQASDGVATSAWVESAPVTIADTAPTVPTVSVTPRLANDTMDLTATATGSVDADGDAITYEYEWASRPTGGTYGAWGNAGNVLSNTLTSNGQFWKSHARATAAGQSSAWVESAEVEVNTLLLSTVPANAATGVNRYTAVTINFRWGVVRSSAEAAFTLTPAGGTPVAGTFTWAPGFTNMTFTPNAPLAASTVYTAALAAGIQSKAGPAIGWGESISFTTNAGPIVVAASPTGTNVPLSSKISITFDQLMHKTSAAQTTTFSPNVHDTYAWLPGGKTIVFTPTAALLPNRTYTVTVGAQTRAANGLTLGKAYIFTFTTGTTLSPAALAMTATSIGGTHGPAAIQVNLSAAATVEASVMNLAGRVVAVLPARDLPEGASTLLWDGRSSSGTAIPGGSYMVRVSARCGDGQTTDCLLPLRR